MERAKKQRTNQLIQKTLKYITCIFLSVTILPEFSVAQNINRFKNKSEMVSPYTSMFKSFLLPGWGGYDLPQNVRGNPGYAMSADIVLLLSAIGLTTYANHLENNMYTFASLHAGTDLRKRNKSFKIAVGNFESLAIYNDSQQRNRYWNNLLPETSENRWEWDSKENQVNYLNMKSTVVQSRNQVPAIITLMIINRIWNGFSTYIKARDYQSGLNKNVIDLSLQLTTLPIENSTINRNYLISISVSL